MMLHISHKFESAIVMLNIKAMANPVVFYTWELITVFIKLYNTIVFINMIV